MCRVWEQYGDERAAEAKKIGILEGKKVGLKEGKKVGILEGKKVGLKEGKRVGILEGKKVGLKEGKLVGLKEGRKEMAANFLKDGTLSVQKIAEISGFSLEQLQEMADEMMR